MICPGVLQPVVASLEAARAPAKMPHFCRRHTDTVLELGVLRNRCLLMSLAIAVSLQMAVVYVPFMQVAFGPVWLPQY